MHDNANSSMRELDSSEQLQDLFEVKILYNRFAQLHNTYFAGNKRQLEVYLKQFQIKLKTPEVDAPSWLED